MEYRAGTRLKSAVCTTEVVVVKPPSNGGVLSCGGEPMIGFGSEIPAGATISADAAGGTLVGKRYVDEAANVEVLCTKMGDGSLALDDSPLDLQDAKPLPSSD